MLAKQFKAFILKSSVYDQFMTFPTTPSVTSSTDSPAKYTWSQEQEHHSSPEKEVKTYLSS